MLEKRHLSDEEEAIQKKNDPGRGGWGDISLLPAETAGFVPSPTLGSRYSTTILVTVVVGLILLSVIMMIMASVSKPATKLMAMDISHTRECFGEPTLNGIRD